MRGFPPRLGLRKLSFATTYMRYRGDIEVLSVRVIDFLDARARLDKVLDQVTEDADYAIISRYDGCYTQFSTRRPATRPNSRILFVTSVSP
mgnify:CR=1 FL=1